MFSIRIFTWLLLFVFWVASQGFWVESPVSAQAIESAKDVESVKLNFAPRTRTITPDGKWMVVNDQYHLAVVDLEKMKRVAEKRMDVMIRLGVTDGKSVAILPLNEDRVISLQLPDLEQKRVRLLPGKAGKGMIGIDGSLMVDIETDRHTKQTWSIGVRDLKATKMPIGVYEVDKMIVGHRAAFRRPDNQYSTARFDLDREGNVVGVRAAPFGFSTWPQKLRMPNFAGSNQIHSRYFSDPIWGRLVMWGNPKNFLQDALSNNLAGIEEFLMLSPDYPILVGYRGTHYHDHSAQLNRPANGVVTFRSLEDGSEITRTTAYKKTISRRVSSLSSLGYSGLLNVQGKYVYVTEEQTLFKVPIPNEVIAKATSPFHLERPRVTLVDLSRPSKIPIRYQGKPNNIKFELEYEIPFVSVDAKTGVVTIEGDKIWDRIVEATNYSPFPSRSNEDFLRKRKQESMQVLGLKPSQMPVAIPVCVKATADGTKWDRVTFFVIGTGPQKELDDRIAQQKKAREDSQSNRLANQGGPKQGSKKTDEERVVELEKRMLKIESMMEKIFEQLKKSKQK